MKDAAEVVAVREHVGRFAPPLSTKKHAEPLLLKTLTPEPHKHAGLVVEDAAKVVAVGEHVGLARQVGAAAVHKVYAGQPAALGDLLQPQMLLRVQPHELASCSSRGGVSPACPSGVRISHIAGCSVSFDIFPVQTGKHATKVPLQH